MRIGMVGLGRMGGNMAERLRRAGHDVVGFDMDPKLTDVASTADLVGALGEPPRAVWIMVPAGAPTQQTIDTLADLLGPGDIVVDGGNSNYKDSLRRGHALAERRIGFVDAGVSGGVWGLEEGYCIMAGGEPSHIALLQPFFDALVTPGGFAHVGPLGAGHFTKMVHNGVEYGMMQALAEGYEILWSAPMSVDVAKAVEVWRHGSVVRSWLLDLLHRALEQDPGLASVRGWAQDSGEGRWTIEAAIDQAVPAPVITAALFARFASRQDDAPAMKVVAALRHQFGGHAIVEEPPSGR